MRSVDQQSLESGAASSGIKLKATEPLSSNPFVSVPLDRQKGAPPPVSSAAPRQKRLRVPRGGSAERFAQSKARVPQPAAAPKQAPQQNPSPSLRIVLEAEPQPEELAAPDAEQQQEDAENLARFAAAFPKIPNGLIFRFPDAEEEQDPAFDARRYLDDDPFDPDGEDAFFGEAGRAPVPGFKGADRAGRREPAYLNPRYEKMIRDAEARTQSKMPLSPSRTSAAAGPASKTARIPAISGPLDRGSRASADLPPRSPSIAAAFSGAPAKRSAASRSGGYALRTQSAPATLKWQDQGFKGSALGPRALTPAASGPLRAQSWAGGLGPKDPRMPASAHPSSIPSALSRNSGPLPAKRSPLQPMAASVASQAVPAALSQVAPAAPSSSARPSDAMNPAQPLLDSHAIEESTIFDEPPIPISEGMKDADKSRNKGRKLLIGSLVLIIVALVGILAFIGTTGTIPVPEFHITTVDNIGKGGQTSPSGDSADDKAASDDDGVQPPSNGAGTVTYRYTAKTASGVEYSVEEKTIFDDAGNCTFTTMAMQFPTEAAAKDFTDSLALDLGAKYTLDSLNGANATVTVDNSGLGLDRQSYENALRYSVDDLVILKK